MVATSGRAIAQGLKSLGHTVTVVDGFADSDTIAATIECKKVKRAQYGLNKGEVLATVVSLQAETSFDGLFCDAAIESNPDLLDKIHINPVFANSSQTLHKCKNPNTFFSLLDQHSISYPETLLPPFSKAEVKNAWLVKEEQSTGGIGVSFVSDATDLTSDIYLQKKINGINFSLTFLANEDELFALGFNALWSEQLSADMPYAYAGAINQIKLDSKILELALQYAKVMVKAFKLLGLNSIDFICQGDALYVLEINPRIPASYELYETKFGEVIGQHIDVCKTGKLPSVKGQSLLRAHAIVYAPTDIKVSESMSWPLWTADRPHSQEVIKQFEPVCSIFAGGQNTAQVCEMIKVRKQTILAKLAQ